MARELRTGFEYSAATSLCRGRAWQERDNSGSFHGLSITNDEHNSCPCPTCRADILRLVDASPSETTGGEVVASLRKRWLADVEMLHLFAKHLDGQTIIGGTATVYDLGRCLRGIASTLTNRVTLETDPRSDHFIDVLTEAMGELRIVRDSSKGSLAQQVAHELRLRSAPPAGDGVPEVRAEDLAWISDLLERAKHDETQEWVVDENPMLERQQYERIYAALSYCATRQGEG